MAMINTASSKQQAVSRDSNPASCSYLLPPRSRGFALLVAIIFMSVMLSFGLALGSLAYKQQILASYALESQYAFYAADAALECALYADQKANLFDYTSHNASSDPATMALSCPGATTAISSYAYTSGTNLVIKERLTIAAATFKVSNTPITTSAARCADVTVYKPVPNSGVKTYIFSQGYDVSCATVASPSGARFVTRGLNVQY